MVRKAFLYLLMPLLLFCGNDSAPGAQEIPNVRVVVNLVQLNVAVTDKNGNYVTGLHPNDFAILEDGITENAATFAEGEEPAHRLDAFGGRSPAAGPDGDQAKRSSDSPQTFDSLINGANVFILFDTSNYMYRGFVFAQDAIAEFVRTIDHPDRVAFYYFSRDY